MSTVMPCAGEKHVNRSDDVILCRSRGDVAHNCGWFQLLCLRVKRWNPFSARAAGEKPQTVLPPSLPPLLDATHLQSAADFAAHHASRSSIISNPLGRRDLQSSLKCFTLHSRDSKGDQPRRLLCSASCVSYRQQRPRTAWRSCRHSRWVRLWS